MTSSTPDAANSADDPDAAPDLPTQDAAAQPDTAAADPKPESVSATEPSIWDNPPESPLPAGYYTDDGVPTFDAVRARIEERSATADGHQELDSELPRERDFRKEREDLEKAGADRLAQLRKSMGLDK